MGKLAGIRITNIDWCVEDEDVIGKLYNWEDLIEKIMNGLPTEEFIPTNKQNLANDLSLLSDWLSDKYGWLVNSFDYNLVDENSNVLV